MVCDTDDRSRRLNARLRCNCETLFATVGKTGAEYVYANSCSAFENDDKAEVIQTTMEQLLSH